MPQPRMPSGRQQEPARGTRASKAAGERSMASRVQPAAPKSWHPRPHRSEPFAATNRVTIQLRLLRQGSLLSRSRGRRCENARPIERRERKILAHPIEGEFVERSNSEFAGRGQPPAFQGVPGTGDENGIVACKLVRAVRPQSPHDAVPVPNGRARLAGICLPNVASDLREETRRAEYRHGAVHLTEPGVEVRGVRLKLV
jgi:hypothetical protein